MDSHGFLKAVLGEDGADALNRAIGRAPVLEAALVPRTIVAWLGSAIQVQYEGEIPGVADSFIAIKKSESGLLSGGLLVGQTTHSFNDESLLHVAAALGVVLGVGGKKLDPALKGQDLSKLGKSIDLLVRGKLASTLLTAGGLRKSIASIAPGKLTFTHPKGGKQFDYNHVLSPEHRSAGYSMHLNQSPHGGLIAEVHHSGQMVGQGVGKVEDGNLNIDSMSIYDDKHLGRGLGSAMYESLMAHAKHNQGATHVVGDIHSSMASKAHQRISTKHGMDYKPEPTPFPHLANPTPGPYDLRHAAYNYAIKEELNSSGVTSNEPKKIAKHEISVTKSEALKKCTDCGATQFRGGRFVACLCLASLAENVKTLAKADGGFTLKLIGSTWDEESILTLIEAFKE